MRNAYCKTWNMARNLKITKNEKYTFQDVEYGEENRKDGKFRNVHCSTTNMARKLKIMENVKLQLDDLKNDKNTEKREK